MGQSRTQATGAESAAHVDPVSAGYKNRSEFSGDCLEGRRAAEHQGISAMAVKGHFKSLFWLHQNGGALDVLGNLRPVCGMRRTNAICFNQEPDFERVSLYL